MAVQWRVNRPEIRLNGRHGSGLRMSSTAVDDQRCDNLLKQCPAVCIVAIHYTIAEERHRMNE